MKAVPRALTIAGSDSGGGAGIQADLKTFAAFGVYGTTALVAVTAQNTRGVWAIHEIPPDMVTAQIDAIVADIGVDAAKTGMLASRELVETVASAVERLKIPNLVVDPVMMSKSGARLLAPDAVEAVRTRLLPLCRIATPNLPEAEILTGLELSDSERRRRAVREIRRMGPEFVVLKGGHDAGDPVDLLYDGSTFTELRGERIRTTSDHGTGCIFAAAIAALLARGEEPRGAVEEAKRFVAGALRSARPIGSGRGPLDPFYRLKLGR